MSDEIPTGDEAQLRDPAIARVVAYARVPAQVRADFADRVLADIRAGALAVVPVRRSGERRRVSRLALAAGIAALMLGSAWAGRMTAPRSAEPAALAPAAPTIADGSVVRFVIAAPGASTVALVGDFNAWNVGATPLQATEREGVWTVTVPLPAGRHEYAFVVDGVRWLSDPNAPRAGTADFGPANSVVTVTGQT
ncbi:MAG TPA: isoamylase early set domain-containing protein [Gemmatimonadales bacterium]|nr:isoamylase early set domain-containing protein [Gemmatimonadales bacterium]